MKADKKILKSAAVIAGALLTTSLIAAPSISSDILAYNDLGSGSELRSQLVDQNQVNANESYAYKFGELKCGEGKCGEGKCGEGDDKKKKEKKKDAKKADSKKADSKETAPAKETKKKK